MTDRKPSARKGRPNSIGEVKLLIFTLSVASVLGFWNLFSKQASLDALVAQAAQPASQQVVLSSQPSQTVMLDLPPLPTLVPSTGSGTTSSVVTQPSTTQSQTVQQSPVRILMGGSAPNTAAQTVTRTRSSR